MIFFFFEVLILAPKILTFNHRCQGLGKPSTLQLMETSAPSATVISSLGGRIKVGGIPVTVKVPESVTAPALVLVVATQV